MTSPFLRAAGQRSVEAETGSPLLSNHRSSTKQTTRTTIQELSANSAVPHPREEDGHLGIEERRSSSWNSQWRGIRLDYDQTKGWKPVTLRYPILGSLVTSSLSIIIILEILSYLSQRPQNGGGLAFAPTVNELSPTTTFGFSYLPTILAVCYSMIWSWVDLDAKRLEPWFQLSLPGGATAKNSLLLQYPFDFLPFVPVSAFRRRQWGVFFAAFIMLMVFWIITPLQSAIFTTGTVTRSINAMMGTSTTLIPLHEQASALTVNFLNTAYGIAWLDQKLPQFTTRDLALLPFHPVEQHLKVPFTESWTTNVDVVYTNLTCAPALFSNDTHGPTFSNGKGCVVPDPAFADFNNQTKYDVAYIGYFDNAQNDWSLQSSDCPVEFSNSFLAFWASSYENFTALFCETSYISQEMSVTVNATTHEVQHFQPTSRASSTIALGDIFNTSHFEYLLGTGVPPTSQKYNYQDSRILQQESRIQEYGISWPNTNMVGFAVAVSDSPVVEWSQPTVLQRTFEKAHQLLFISAFSTLSSPIGGLQNVRPGLRTDLPGAVVLVRSISIIVEVGIGVIIAFTISLWYYYHIRPSLMLSDPASIADIMSMIPSSGDLVTDMHDNGRLTSDLLENALSNKKYQFMQNEYGEPYICSTSSKQLQRPQPGSSPRSSTSTSSQNVPLSLVLPKELRLVFGIIFIGLLLAALAGMLFLYRWSLNRNGIFLPTNNPIVLSIIENYAPTAFATLVEPTWVVLNRLLCVLQPFEELRKGNAAAFSSVEVKYTNLPPQLAVWRAVRAKHFLLAMVSITAVSTNFLAVALSALINQGETTVPVSFDSTYQFSPHFNETPNLNPNNPSGYFNDHFYVVMSNLSHGTSLPPWIDTGFYYIPFDIHSVAASTNPMTKLQSFSGLTMGFGANVTCTELTDSGTDDRILFDLNSNGTSLHFSTSHFLPNGTMITCVPPRFGLEAFTDGPTTLEVVQHMTPDANTTDDGLCAAMMTMGWVRVGPGAAGVSSYTTNRQISKTFLSCTPHLLAAQFKVTVDSSGRILNANRTTAFAEDLRPYFSLDAAATNLGNEPTQSEIVLWQQSADLIAPLSPGFGWHNDSFTTDWMNSLLGMMLNSSSLVDPSAPLPNATFMAPIVEGLYATLFASILGLNTHVFPLSTEKLIAQGNYTQTRLFISPLMFRVSVIILSFQIFVAVLYYANRPKRFLPRTPTSIASIIAFVAASRAVEDFNGSYSRRAEKDDGEGERRYGYGRFVGTDGRTKVGIERQRFVVPLEVKNPHARKRGWWARIRGGDEGEVRSWI